MFLTTFSLSCKVIFHYMQSVIKLLTQCTYKNSSAVADLRGGAGDTSRGQIFFSFMQFSGNFNKTVLTLRVGAPPPPYENPGSATAPCIHMPSLARVSLKAQIENIFFSLFRWRRLFALWSSKIWCISNCTKKDTLSIALTLIVYWTEQDFHDTFIRRRWPMGIKVSAFIKQVKLRVAEYLFRHI